MVEDEDSEDEELVPYWLRPLTQKTNSGPHAVKEERRRSLSSGVEILPPPERVGEVKVEHISRSTEGGVEDLISFNDGDLLQPRLDCSLEGEISLSDVEPRGDQTYTNPDIDVADLPFPESDSLKPSLEHFSFIRAANLDTDCTAVQEDFSPIQRRNINPPKRLTYDVLGENSDKPIPTFQQQRSVPDSPTVLWVGGDLDSPTDTTGWATAIALACKQTDRL